MRSGEQSELRAAISGMPEGWGCAPLFPVHGPAPVQVCAVVARPEAGGGVGGVGRGGLVLIRDLLDARLVLGCLVDAAYQPIEWVEIEIQDPRALASAPFAASDAVSNATLDQAFLARQARTSESGAVTLGCEGIHPPPTWIRQDTLDPVTIPDHEGGPWLLCQDDEALRNAGLPEYARSLHRYLWCPGLGSRSPMIPLADDAPRSAQTAELSEALSSTDIDPALLLPLNPAAGLLACRRYHPVPVLDFAAAIGGRPWDQVMHGRPAVRAFGGARAMSSSADRVVGADGRIFTGRDGRRGRMAEALHLKLRLIDAVLQQVIDSAGRTRMPLLNLTDESFRVRLPDDPAPGVPVLWSGRVMLSQAGAATRAVVSPGGPELFVPLVALKPSFYRPEDVSRSGRGAGTVVTRSVEVNPAKLAVVSATLKVDDGSSIRPQDWVWLRPTVGDRRVSLMGLVDPESALSAGEVRFRTEPQSLDEEALDHLRRVSGVQLNDVPYQSVARLGAGCDLYSIGILALRILLTGSGDAEGTSTQEPIPAAETIDDALSLAREVTASADSGQPLDGRIALVLKSDARWTRRLGPQRLIDEGVSVESAFRLVPLRLWARVLGFCIRMLPGAVPESFARSVGDGATLPPIAVVTRPVQDLSSLLEQSRALLFGDWQSNREIHMIIDRLRRKTAGS